MCWAQVVTLQVNLTQAPKVDSVTFDTEGRTDADVLYTAAPPESETSVPSWHWNMLSDTLRNDRYDTAIKEVIETYDGAPSVLDIGTGSGLLAMMAARAGAVHVYGCEMDASLAQTAQKIVAENGLSDRVTVFPKMCSELVVGEDLPRDFKADVIVTETMGDNFCSEMLVGSLTDAVAVHGHKGTQTIPARGVTHAQLIHIDTIPGEPHILPCFSVGL